MKIISDVVLVIESPIDNQITTIFIINYKQTLLPDLMSREYAIFLKNIKLREAEKAIVQQRFVTKL